MRKVCRVFAEGVILYGTPFTCKPGQRAPSDTLTAEGITLKNTPSANRPYSFQKKAANLKQSQKGASYESDRPIQNQDVMRDAS